MNADPGAHFPPVETGVPLLGALARTIDEILEAPAHPTGVVGDPMRRVARLGLSLDPSPTALQWADASGQDALFLHRSWAARRSAGQSDGQSAEARSATEYPGGLLVNHDGFDQRFGFGDARELLVSLGLTRDRSLGNRDGFPLGWLATGAPRSVGELGLALTGLFGPLDGELPAGDGPHRDGPDRDGPDRDGPDRDGPEAESQVTVVALARAMSPALVERAAGLGAQAYVTGQLRSPAMAAALASGMRVFAVGHRASERWALEQLAGLLRARWPGISVRCAPEPSDGEPHFFPDPAAWRAWLETHHESETEVSVGLYKRGSGKAGMTWPEAVDVALCFGWIDGITHGIDTERYRIRFTPRRSGSIWSAVNIARIEALTAAGLMHRAGLVAFAARREGRSRVYSHEQEGVELPPAMDARLRSDAAATAFFDAQPASYRRTTTWWIVSAKQQPTRERRFEALLEHSRRGERVPQFTRQVRPGDKP